MKSGTSSNVIKRSTNRLDSETRYLSTLAALVVTWYGSSSLNAVATQSFKTEQRLGQSGNLATDSMVMTFVTVAQLLSGSVIGSLILAILRGKLPQLWDVTALLNAINAPATSSKLWWRGVISVLHGWGSLSTNLGFCYGSASIVQIIKLLEPITTLIVSKWLGSTSNIVTYETIGALTLLLGGTMATLSGWDKPPAMGAIIFASMSGFFLATRNATKKRRQELNASSKTLQEQPKQPRTFVSGVEDFVQLSFWSASVLMLQGLLHVMLFPYRAAEAFATVSLLWKHPRMIVFHALYNLASLGVLQYVSALTHSVLNVGKRLSNIIVALIEFQERPELLRVAVGLVLASTGMMWYATLSKGGNFRKHIHQFLWRFRHALVISVAFGLIIFNVKQSTEAMPSASVPELILPISTTPTDGARLVVWAYPLPPNARPSLAGDEMLYCAYPSACRDLPHQTINLRKLTRGHPLFSQFCEDHMLLKVAHGERFVDHLHSVVMLRLLQLQPTTGGHPATIRSLGEDEVFHWNDVTSWQGNYNPNWYNVTPRLIPASRPDLTDLKFLTFKFQKGGEGNSGDEIQDMTGVQFAPYITALVKRDHGWHDKITPMTRGNVIANSWYGNAFYYPFGLEERVNMTFVSIHSSGPGKKYAQKDHNLNMWKHYTETFGPIGARDSATFKFFKEELGLPTFFSRCMTLMLQLGCRAPNGPPCEDSPRNEIIFNDVKGLPAEVETALKVKHNVTRVKATMNIFRSDELFPNTFEYAHNLLKIYAHRAKLVVTSRLHSALPALALGVPVVFVKPKKLPGGGGNRLAGIYEVLNTYEPGNEEWTIDPDNPPPNPGLHIIDRNRAALWNVLHKRNQFYNETARLFGMIPLLRLGDDSMFSNLYQNFHFVVVSESDMSWQFKRAIEAVFYHHPHAHVRVHSLDLSANANGLLSIFPETGYHLEVLQYKPDEIKLQSTHDKRLFMAMRVLDQFGGVYVGPTTYIVQPLHPEKHSNRLGRSSNGEVSLATAVPTASVMTAATKAARSGARIEWKDGSVELLTPIEFDPYQGDWENCFSSNQTRLHVNDTLAVYMDENALKRHDILVEGTVCDDLLYRHCILCNELHTQMSPKKET